MTAADPAWPSVSVTMLVHQSRDTSAVALRSIVENGYEGALEVLVREQGGDRDEYEALVAVARDDARVTIERGDNLGFCAGHERLVGQTTGAVVVLVNDDARLEPGYLSAVAKAFGDANVGSVQGLLVSGLGPVSGSSIVDTTGLILERSRRVLARDRGRPSVDARRSVAEVWGVDGAVLALRRTALDEVRDDEGRLFPVEFGSYMEDMELAWRLRRFGWASRYTPAAVAAHVRGTVERSDLGVRARIVARRSRSLDAHVGGFVNLRLAQLRHDSLPALVRDLPWWLPREIAAWAALVVVTPRAVAPVVRGLAAGFGPSWRARRSLRRRLP